MSRRSSSRTRASSCRSNPPSSRAFNSEDGGIKARIGSTTYAGRYYAGVAATDPNVNIYEIALGTAPLAVNLASLSFGIDQYPTHIAVAQI
ncbi:hypothetical protein BDI4_210052 [Burkholderia diffusa]|uniref:hypothetical protein n=1 Tax=Burkholderia diffusa TaxID=488732 RepID=UPI001CB2AC67|nr:hypothetical protein [Burkholderia diffusa]CAG9247773.1 hypothetical protein BDI4_210052 [Burkholderia diffusa]